MGSRHAGLEPLTLPCRDCLPPQAPGDSGGRSHSSRLLVLKAMVVVMDCDVVVCQRWRWSRVPNKHHQTRRDGYGYDGYGYGFGHGYGKVYPYPYPAYPYPRTRWVYPDPCPTLHRVVRAND